MHDIKYSKQAEKYIKKLDKVIQKRIDNSVLKLAESPYDSTKSDIKKLKKYDSEYRLRIGDIRLRYEVVDKTLTLHILEAGNRSKFY